MRYIITLPLLLALLSAPGVFAAPTQLRSDQINYSPTSASRAIIHVSKAATATNTRTGLSAYDEARPFATISAAISAASSGDLIRVGPGTFTENSGISLPSGVSLVGAGIDVTKITSTLADSNHAVLVPGNNSWVSDLTVSATSSSPGSSALGCQTSDSAFTNVFLSKVKFTSTTTDCVSFTKESATNSLTAYDCIFTSNYDVVVGNTSTSTDTIEFWNCSFTADANGTINPARAIVSSGASDVIRLFNSKITTQNADSTAANRSIVASAGTVEAHNIRIHRDSTGVTGQKHDLFQSGGTLAVENVSRDDGAVLVTSGTITQLSRYALRDNNLSDLPTPATAFDTLTVTGSDVASASTTNIGAATGYYINVTGTTTITAFDNVAAGRLRIVKFGGALTLTHNSTSLILPGAANITTVAGDTAIFESLGSGNWRCVGYFPTTVSGTGAAIRQTSPTFVTPNIGVATATSVNNSTVPSSDTLVGRATTDTLTNKTINSSTNTIGDGNTFSHDLTATPNDTGGWTEYKVSGTDVTYNGQTLQDITGLVSGTLSNSTLYEFEAKLIVTTSADTTGIKYGVHGGGTGTAATVSATIIGTSSAAGASVGTIGSIDTGSGTLMTGSAVSGEVVIAGHFTTCGTGTATLSLQHLKVTSGTSTVKIGSKLRIRKA